MRIFRVSKEGGIFGEGWVSRPGFTVPFGPPTSGSQTARTEGVAAI